MNHASKVTNPKHPVVRTAIQNACPVCSAKPGQPCHQTNRPNRSLGPTRVVHYARCAFKADPA